MSEEIYDENTDEEILSENENHENQNEAQPVKEKELAEQPQRKSSFYPRFIAGIVLALLAFYFILPNSGSTILYLFYFGLFIAFTVGVFYCIFQANKSVVELKDFYKSIQENRGRYSALKADNPKINEICNAYKKSFLISEDEDYHKTRANSDLYFGSETWVQDINDLPVQPFLKIIPATFIGFGILGTFIGFAGGLSEIGNHFTGTDTAALLDGVKTLLQGLKYAFNTSIVGVLASMFLNFMLIHPLFNRLDRVSKELCDYLDMQFFVTEVDAMAIIDENNNKKPFPVVLTEILTRLEGVSSNINTMGLTIGNQVTTSVKETLDKTIEKIIKAEITKLKEEMNSSISLLKECQTHLQNAPQHLKEAAINMENSSKNSAEIFEKFTKEVMDIKEAISLMPDDFTSVNNAMKSTIDKLAENQQNLANALSESKEAFNKATEISEALSESYEEQSAKIETAISRFSDILNEYKETSKESKELIAGFKGMDEQIAKIFAQVNENTQNYGKIVGESLENYFKGFQNATQDISKQFADATLALSEEVARLNSSK